MKEKSLLLISNHVLHLLRLPITTSHHINIFAFHSRLLTTYENQDSKTDDSNNDKPTADPTLQVLSNLTNNLSLLSSKIKEY
jgi:hypothetical protein